MKIGLIGTYDVDNFGDCLFPDIYISEIRKRIPDAEFQCYSPMPTAAVIFSHEVAGVPKSPDEIGKTDCDALLLTGGETIRIGHSDGTYIFPKDTFSAGLRMWLAPLLLAARNGIPFVMHSVGLAPAATGSYAEVVPLLRKATYVTVRDAYSKDTLHQHGLESELAVDPVFKVADLLDEAEWKRRAARLLRPDFGPRSYIVAQITPSYLDFKLSEWCVGIAEIAKRYNKQVLLLPICHFLRDELILERALPMLNQLGVDSTILGGRINVKDTAAVISQSAGYCGTSLHGAVVAVGFGIPVAVKASPTGKHAGVLASIGLEGVVSMNPYELPVCFMRCTSYDMNSIRKYAIRCANVGLDVLVAQLRSGRGAEPVPAAQLQAICATDRAPAMGVTMSIRRGVLNALKGMRGASEMYFMIRQHLRGVLR